MQSQACVLCVDGPGGPAPDLAEILEAADEPFEVVQTTERDEGLDRLESADFDCVVTRQLGHGDTLAFLATVRERFPDLPAVNVVDGRGELPAPAIASEALEHGATEYVMATHVTESPDLLVRRVAAAIERHEDERALEQYRSLVSTVGDPMFVLDPEGTIVFTNDAMLEVLGCDEGDVLGIHVAETLAAGDFERGRGLVGDILADGDRDWGTFEVTIEPFEGEPFPAEVNVAPALEEGGSYRATVGVVRDVSERRRRERRLAALHDTTRRLIEASDVDDTLRIGLEAAADVLGLELAAFYRPAPEDEALVPAAVTDGVRDLLDEIPTVEPGQGLVWQAYESDEPIFAEDVGSRPDVFNPETQIESEMLIPAGDHGVFVASSTDPAGFDATDEELAGVLVSNLSRAIGSVQREDRLRRRERELEQYETLVHTFPDEVYSLDAEGRFTSIVPPTGSELTTSGYEPEELIGEHVSLVMDEEDIETGERLIEELIRSDDRNRASFEMEIITRSGERIAHENHVALLPPEDDGSFRGTVGVLRNITDRKARERELERQNERLEEFAHIASHDLRNPLNLAAGRLELARDDCDSPHLDHVAEALERMGTLIDDTLTMATEGQTVSTVTTVDLPNLARRSWDAVPGDVATLLVADDLAIRGDPDRLARVLENLFRNAVEHGGPEVSVRVGPLEDGFYVADDGPGIPEGERSAVFEVGHSAAEGGTGFGLAIVREIVEAHGWEIRITDAEIGGTRFEITGVDRL